MTSPFPDSPGVSLPPAGSGHATEDLLSRYATGAIDGLSAWSVEAHLMACARCRAALSSYVDARRLARNRSMILVRTAIPADGRVRRLLRRCGIPDHVVSLLAATPSLRPSWILAVTGVLALVVGETALTSHGWSGNGPSGAPWAKDYLAQWSLVPYLLVAPLLALAGVAAAFMPMFDPSYQLTVAAPFSGFALLLVRATSALSAALIPTVCAGLLLPGPRWLPAALLLPSLALCAFALAAVTIVGPVAGAVSSGVLWAMPAVLLVVPAVGNRSPLEIVQWRSQAACAALLLAATVVFFLRHDRIESGPDRFGIRRMR